MKKIILLFSVLFLMFGCLSNNQVVIDTSKSIKIFKVDLNIKSIFYDEEKDMYVWDAFFLDKYNENKEINVCCVANEIQDYIIKKIIENGNYNIKALIILDLKKSDDDPDKYLIYPIWIYKNKSLKLDIIKILLNDEGSEI